MDFSKKTVRTIVILMIFAALLFMVAQDPAIVPKLFFGIITPLTPLWIGIIIALFMNVPMNFIENYIFHFWKKKKNTHLCRIVALLLSFLLVLGILTLLIVLIAPSISNSLIQITENASTYVETLRAYLTKWNLPSNFLPTITGTGLSGIIEFIQSLLNVNIENANLLSNIANYASSIFGATFNAIIGLIFAIYILLQKERVIYFFARFCHAILPERFYRKSTEIAKFSSYTLSNFISGQLLHAFLFGCIMLVIMLIAKIPYAVLLASLIAIFALVPYVGAFLSAAIAFILILTISPFKAFLFIALYLITQQLDDHIIYPKFVGKSIGVPGLVVLLAVTIGSAVGGVIGMVFGVPVIAVIYHYTQEFVNARLAKKEAALAQEEAKADPNEASNEEASVESPQETVEQTSDSPTPPPQEQ